MEILSHGGKLEPAYDRWKCHVGTLVWSEILRRFDVISVILQLWKLVIANLWIQWQDQGSNQSPWCHMAITYPLNHHYSQILEDCRSKYAFIYLLQNSFVVLNLQRLLERFVNAVCFIHLFIYWLIIQYFLLFVSFFLNPCQFSSTKANFLSFLNKYNYFECKKHISTDNAHKSTGMSPTTCVSNLPFIQVNKYFNRSSDSEYYKDDLVERGLCP